MQNPLNTNNNSVSLASSDENARWALLVENWVITPQKGSSEELEKLLDFFSTKNDLWERIFDEWIENLLFKFISTSIVDLKTANIILAQLIEEDSTLNTSKKWASILKNSMK